MTPGNRKFIRPIGTSLYAFRFAVERVPGTLDCRVIDTADGSVVPVPACERVDANHLAGVLNRWVVKGELG